MLWSRSCAATEGCAGYLAPLPGTVGITAVPLCNRLAGGCDRRRPCRFDDLPSHPQVEGRVAAASSAAGIGVAVALRCVVERVAPGELDLLVSWCRHFSAKGVPWLVARSGTMFAIYRPA